MPDPVDADVIVVGAGPSGAAVALALARMHHRVVVIGVPRRFSACEGISERALGGMRDAGFAAALADVAAPSPREVCWNGERRAANTERLLARAQFDRGLRSDLAAAGLGVIAARVERIERAGEGELRVHAAGRAWGARLVVDARGRAAARAAARRRGPETVSLLQRWSGPDGGPASTVFSFADGWAWLARTAGGARYTQLTVAADTAGIPRRAGLQAWLRARLDALPEAREWVEACTPEGATVARSSTAVVQAPLYAGGVLRVGDAATAVDPLSGNGIFQALASASVAPAVINTLLREPAARELAIGFYEARVQHLFERFARIGRDFYRAETRWAGEAFWAARAAWPDELPAHGSAAPALLGTALRPVVDNGFVRERTVAITSDQPLGVWRVAGVEIAPLLVGLPQDRAAAGALLRARVAVVAAGDGRRAEAIRGWLGRYGLL
jgi:flavin-dependent dehydrogenase